MKKETKGLIQVSAGVVLSLSTIRNPNQAAQLGTVILSLDSLQAFWRDREPYISQAASSLYRRVHPYLSKFASKLESKYPIKEVALQYHRTIAGAISTPTVTFGMGKLMLDDLKDASSFYAGSLLFLGAMTALTYLQESGKFERHLPRAYNALADFFNPYNSRIE